MYTVIYANEEQQEAILNKHLKARVPSTIKKFFGLSNNAVVSRSFSYDTEDDIGFVELKLATGKTCSYQLRGEKPCFVEISGFDKSIRYDIGYPKKEMYDILQSEGIIAKNNFWKGCCI